ncbi:hypothetical protein MM213_01025 [Belliella sp. R4-6]|uniref:RimK-like ATP-grasp domain-containing protein n=1 Tax=Belliella alkalica TaxID=1730871 RepID=A0ABS9V6L1_9BACT|nr:hypothetical protein [Belliella alkalica]MCH7412049.1 hypothetical protein [Belliella alkalica]
MIKLAIHNSKRGFHLAWIAYCEANCIPYKLVNCLSDDLIQQLQDCHALLWHHSHMLPNDLIAAKPILAALTQASFPIFPNLNTTWHFDDKLGQKYLLEVLGLPFVNTYLFYDASSAKAWAKKQPYPLVNKLRTGSGSKNVKLIQNYRTAKQIINKAFGKGFSNYNPIGSLKERIYQFKQGRVSWVTVLKGLLRFLYFPAYARILGREKGYVLFQEFIPNNPSDIRIIVIGERAFGITRWVRDHDFRASGSGDFSIDPNLIPLSCVQDAFEAYDKIKGQCIAFDFVMDGDLPKIIEISFGFDPKAFRPCPGYWQKDLSWVATHFIPEHWMVDDLIKQINASK